VPSNWQRTCCYYAIAGSIVHSRSPIADAGMQQKLITRCVGVETAGVRVANNLRSGLRSAHAEARGHVRRPRTAASKRGFVPSRGRRKLTGAHSQRAIIRSWRIQRATTPQVKWLGSLVVAKW
jgi:hypothetical protein